MRRALALVTLVLTGILASAQGGLTPQDVPSLIALRTLGVGQVENVAFAPNGKLMLVGGTAGAFLIETGTDRPQLDALDGRDFPASDVTISPDGRLAAAASFDYSVRVWDIDSGALLWHSYLESGFPSTVAFNASSTVLYVGSDSGGVVAFAQDGSVLWTLGTERDVRLTAMAVYGDVIATGDRDGMIRLVDGTTVELLNEFRAHSDEGVSGVAFSPDGAALFSVGWNDQTGNLWNVATGELLNSVTLDERAEIVYGLALSPGATQVALAVDGGLLLGSTSVDAELALYADEQRGLLDVAFSPDGALVAAVSGDVLVVRDAFDGTLLSPVHFNFSYTHLALSPDGTQIAAADEVGKFELYDLTGEGFPLTVSAYDVITGIAYSADGQRILTAGDSSIAEWSLSGEQIFSADLESPAGPLAALPGGGAVVALEDGSVLAFRDRLSATPDARKDSTTSAPVTAITASADGQWVLIGDASGHLTAWQPFGDAPAIEWDSSDGPVTALAISPDAQFMFVGTDLGATTLWAQNPEAPGSYTARPALAGHDDSITGAAFSPNSSLLVTGGRDDRAIFWDVITGELLDSYYHHNNDVTGVAFSPDGRLIWTVGWDGTVRAIGIP